MKDTLEKASWIIEGKNASACGCASKTQHLYNV